MKNVVDYEHCILQPVSSIRNYFGLPCYHHTDEDVTNWLKKNQFQQIIVLLIDGMGSYQLRRDCKPDGFLLTHEIKSISTVYPPTTVAATTAVMTGKSPYETGWLGWQQYFKEIDEHLIMFLNRKYYKKEAYEVVDYPYHKVSVQSMVEECIAHGVSASLLFPAFHPKGVHSFSEMCERILDESYSQQHRFLYAYWDGYDSYMHEHGASARGSREMLHHFDEVLEATMHQLAPNTGLMIVADHGHVDVRCAYLCDYPELLECLHVLPALEARAVAFYVKEGMQDIFQERFHHCFQHDFILYTKAEVLAMQLFGTGKEHPLFQDFIGDFIACAISDLELVYDYSMQQKGSHAGMMKEELTIPLILFSNKKQI